MSKRIKDDFLEFIPSNMPEFVKPHIELCSNKRAVVDGCKGILVYNGECVKLNCKGKILTFIGSCLCLTSLSEEQITVSGTINSVEIES